MQLKWSNPHVVEEVHKIRPQWEQSSISHVLLTPCSILKFFGPRRGEAASLIRGRCSDGYLGTYLQAMFFKDGRDLVIVSNGAMI